MMVRIPIAIVSVFFLLGSTAHFLVPDFFMKAMPDYLGFHWEIIIISGVFELVGAVGLLIKKYRLVSGYGLIALSIAVFPANIHMALHPEQFSSIPEIYLYFRLPIQILIIIFIWWAIKPERVQKSNRR